MSESMGRAVRKTHRWRLLVDWGRVYLDPVCGICGKGIDLALPHTHRWSYTLDHIVPIARGGSPFDTANLQPAHRSCNSSKADNRPRRPEGVTSRDW